MTQQCLNVAFKIIFNSFWRQAKKCLSIPFIHETVMENSVDFVYPKSHQFGRFGQMRRWDQEETSNHTGKVSEIKDVMRFFGCGSELRDTRLVDMHCGGNKRFCPFDDFRLVLFSKMPVYNGSKNFLERVVVKGINSEDGQMTEKTGCDVVSTPACWWSSDSTHEKLNGKNNNYQCFSSDSWFIPNIRLVQTTHRVNKSNGFLLIIPAATINLKSNSQLISDLVEKITCSKKKYVFNKIRH